MAASLGADTAGQHRAAQPQLCASGKSPSSMAAATGATDLTHFSAPPETSPHQLRSPFQRAAAEAVGVHGLEVPVAMMSWASDDTTSDQDVAAVIKTASTGIRKTAAAVPPPDPTDPLSSRLPPDMGSATFERIKDANQVVVAVAAAPKVEHTGIKTRMEGSAAVAPTNGTPRRASALPAGTRSDSSRAGLGLPPLGSGPLAGSLARLTGRSPKASGISVITSDDINRQTEAARRAAEAKAALGAAELQPLKQSMLLRGSADAVTVAFGGVTTGAGGQTHNDLSVAGLQCKPGFCPSGDQLSPRGSLVTTSLPFAPGFGYIGANHGRGPHATKGDPDYTPPGNGRPTTRAASRRRGRNATTAQRLLCMDADFTNDEADDLDFDDDPGSPRRGRKKVGRPITFKGDINNPNLTNEERRRIKRRVANRESAQRVRHKRQVQLEELQSKVTALSAQNVELKGALAEADAARTLLAAQVEGLRARWSGNTQRAALLQARASAITAAQQHQQQHQQHPQAPLPKVVLSTAPMVPEPSTEPMTGVCSPFSAAATPSAAAIGKLPSVPDLDMLVHPLPAAAPKVLPAPQPAVLHLVTGSQIPAAAAASSASTTAGEAPVSMDVEALQQPGGGLCMQPPTFCDTLPFAEELAAVAAQLAAPLPQLGTDRSTSPLLAATSLDLPPCSQAMLGGGEGSAFHAVGPAQPINNITVTRNLSWSLDAADPLTPALSPDAEDIATRVSPQPWGLYRHGTMAGAC